MFLPPAQAILEHRVLDVNKIQFALAATSRSSCFARSGLLLAREFRSQYDLKTREAYLRWLRNSIATILTKSLC